MLPDTHLPWPRTGHAEMDRQHDRLRDVIMQVYAGITNDSQTDTRATIAAFAQAVADHLAYEGGLMARTHFPGAHDHLSDHRAIAVAVQHLTEALDAGQNPREVMDQTLTIWQAHHIGGLDQALATHVLATDVAEHTAG